MIDLINRSHTLVFGCGNPLFGDDGFGPAVIHFMEKCYIPAEGCAFIDVGTSIRDILFDIILSERQPGRIIILDAVDMPGRYPGELFDIDVDEVQPEKNSDFSLHQFPTTNMLKELKENTSIDIRLMVVQIKSLPDRVAPGLSIPVQKAVPVIANELIGLLGGRPVYDNVGMDAGDLVVEIVF